MYRAVFEASRKVGSQDGPFHWLFVVFIQSCWIAIDINTWWSYVLVWLVADTYRFVCVFVGWLFVWWVGVVGWLVGCLVGWLAGWLVGWLVGWLAGWLVGWLVDWLINWLIGLSDWLIDWFDWLIDWLIDWLTDWFDWFDWLIHLIDLIGWLIDWLFDCIFCLKSPASVFRWGEPGG